MSKHTPEEVAELIKFHSAQCNKLVNGTCNTLRCMKRGGWPDLKRFNDSTCEYLETTKLLARLERVEEELDAMKLGHRGFP